MPEKQKKIFLKVFPLPVTNFNFLFKDIFCSHEIISLIFLVYFSSGRCASCLICVNALSVPLLTKFHFTIFKMTGLFLTFVFYRYSNNVPSILLRLSNNLFMSISKYAFRQFKWPLNLLPHFHLIKSSPTCRIFIICKYSRLYPEYLSDRELVMI